MATSEVTAAAMRWYTAHQQRMEATRVKGIADKRCKAMPTYSPSYEVLSLKVALGQAQDEAGRQLTALKGVERRAMRQLGKACAAARNGGNADDASMVIDALAIPYARET